LPLSQAIRKRIAFAALPASLSRRVHTAIALTLIFLADNAAQREN
jgi:hypothetical protein